jgi:hypothetical protein
MIGVQAMRGNRLLTGFPVPEQLKFTKTGEPLMNARGKLNRAAIVNGFLGI